MLRCNWCNPALTWYTTGIHTPRSCAQGPTVDKVVSETSELTPEATEQYSKQFSVAHDVKADDLFSNGDAPE